MRNLLVALALAGISCASGEERRVSESIAAAVAAGPGSAVVLGDIAPFTWDRVCLLGPYTAAQEVERLSGLPGAATSAHGIESSDSINVLMFIADKRIAASIAHPRRDGDFAPELVGACYPRRDASFVVRLPPARGSGNIGPRE